MLVDFHRTCGPIQTYPMILQLGFFIAVNNAVSSSVNTSAFPVWTGLASMDAGCACGCKEFHLQAVADLTLFLAIVSDQQLYASLNRHLPIPPASPSFTVMEKTPA